MVRHEVPRELIALADRITTYGRSAAAAEFGGCYFDSTARLHVIFTGNLDQHRAAMRQERLDITQVTFEIGSNSAADLAALASQIMRDRPILEELGIHVTSVGEATDDNKVAIALQSGDRSALHVLEERYGHGKIEITDLNVRATPTAAQMESRRE